MAFLIAGLALTGCAAERAPSATGADTLGFVNRVWQVSRSTAVETGMIYVFLSDGTLLLSSPHGTPAVGSWKIEDGVLTMVEEGRPYRVDILRLDDAGLTIRSHDPGGSMEISLVPAETPPLPEELRVP